MKYFWMTFLCLTVCACGGAKVDYKPDISNVMEPEQTIRSTLEEQPVDYSYMVSGIEVNDRYVSYFTDASGKRSGHSTRLFYRNIGEMRLSKHWRFPTWEIVIYDNRGNDAALIVVESEGRAREFMNALQYMITKAKSGDRK